MKQNLFLILFMAFFPLAMMAYDSEVDGIYYNLDTSAKTAEVTFDYLDAEDGYYPRYSGSVTIPSSIVVGGTTYTVTSIGNYAFYCCRTYINEEEDIYIGLTSITIPSTVTSIGYDAFGGCTGLTSVTIPSRVTSIGDYAFAGCTSLTSITIPSSVTSIGNYAFQNCTSMTSVTIPSRVTSIGYNAFYYCSSLTSVTVENLNPLRIESSTFSNRTNATLYVPAGSLAAYQEAAYWQDFNHIEEFITFSNSNVKSICLANWDTNSDGKLSISEAEAVTSLGSVFKNNTDILSFKELQYFKGLTSIDSYAFSGCSGLRSVIIPNSVKTIGYNAFESCYNLTNVDIPNSVTRIEDYAFYNCDMLTSVTIPSSVTAIGPSAFGGFQSHGSTPNIYISDLEAWCNIKFERGGFWYYLYLNEEKVDNLIIPNTITKIGDYAFSRSHITSVEIPTSVTSIGAGAFESCPLTNVTIPNSVTKINKETFSNCSSLKSVTIPNSVTTIGDDAFMNCEQLSRVSIPNSVTTIGRQAFYSCDRLNIIIVGNSVTSIGDLAFTTGCLQDGLIMTVGVESPVNVVYGLVDALPNNKDHGTLFVPEGCKDAYKVADGWKEFGNIVEMEASSPTISFVDANVKALCMTKWDANDDGELSMVEAATVTDLGEVFKENAEITSFDELQYFTGLTSIGNYAFYGCTGLTSIDIPCSVTSIREGAFYGCTGLTSVSIPNGVTSIEEFAFSSCIGLTSVTIPNGVTSVENYAFQNCSGLTSVTIPNGVTSIGDYAFQNCSDLTSVTIPNGVTSIGYRAFDGCSSLTSVTVENPNPVSIGYYTFSNRANATLFVPVGSLAAYQAAEVWKKFGTIVEMEEQGISPDDIYLLKNVETGKYLYTGNAWGTHAVLADIGLPAQFNKQSDGSYTIFFPVGSGNQQMLFRDNETDVFVDYLDDGCPFWTFTNTDNGNYLIQTLTTHETYGQEAMPGTYLGNDPTKEGVYNDVDGNVTNAEGMNITWTLEPVSARSNAQVSLLQELITTAQELDMDTGEEEMLLNNQEATYLEMTGTIVDLQKRINETINQANKKKEDLNMLIACANAIGVDTDDAQAVANNSSSLEEMNEAINSLRETYITKLGEGIATTLLPLNVTGVILNPSFVIDDADGWSWNEEEDGPRFESWNNAEYFQRTFDFHQQITGLPNGNYILKVKGFHRPGSNEDVFSDYQQGNDNASAQLYANDESVTLVNQASCAQDEQIEGWSGYEVSSNGTTQYVPDNMHDANVWFAKGYYENELPVTVTDGTLTLGIRLDESVEKGWVIFDDFRLEYQGTASPAITFADDNVKALCLANWDTNEDGELSYAEAAAVTDLGEVFIENAEITSFDELQYFTGLTSIGYYAFNGCVNLTSVIIPNNVTSIGQEAFSGSGGLQTVIIPNGVTSIGVWAFAYTGLNQITLPASVTNIGEVAFSYCGALTSINVEWEEPLVVPENIFEGINYNNVTLYVPDDTKEAYKTADVWKEFFIDGDDRDEYNTKRLLRELIANMEAIGGYELDDAMATAYGTDVTKDDIEGAITQLQQQIKDRCANAESDDLPVDVTGLITNPTFTIDNDIYWAGDTPQFQTYNNAEFFETTFDFHQQITDLPNGNYILKVKGFHRPGSNEDVFSDYQQGNDNASAQLYANDESVTLVNQASCAQDEQIEGWSGYEVSSNGTTQYVPDNMHDANVWFAKGYYENELSVTVTDGTLTLGIRLDESVEKGWVIFDDFRLVYLGEEEQIDENNRLYADDATGRSGATVIIPLMLKTEDDYAALQCVIKLPDGFTLSKVTRTNRVPTNDIVQSNSVGDNEYQLLVYSTNRETFVGNDGALVELHVGVDNTVEDGTYTIQFSDIHVSDIDTNIKDLASAHSNITISNTLLVGDVNNDGKVLVNDIMGVANYILKINMPVFNEQAADVNGDGRILVNDIMGIANIILKINTQSSNQAPRMEDSLDPQ